MGLFGSQSSPPGNAGGLAREIVPGIVWTVSALYVAGYTWSAIAQEKKDFPFPAFGGSGNGSSISGALSQIPVLGSVGTFLGNTAANIYNSLFGPNIPSRPANLPSNQEAARLVVLAKRHPLPGGFTSGSLRMIAKNGNARQKQQAVQGFTAWAKAHGWKQADITSWLQFANLAPSGNGGTKVETM